ncbi:hypothetical protein [Actinomycetospora sp. CA-084318]|uniref:hypothetical protein n=1 Tax=Actinomycetospora sp. CA-084318 TaxID=3239892 RepID=UPI003D99C14B
MLAVALGIVVVGLVVIGIASVRRRRGGDPRSVTSYEPAEGSALGQVPGYMPGMRRRVEPHDETAAELVVPPREQGVDLDANEVRVRRTG